MNPEMLAMARRLRLAGCSWVEISLAFQETRKLRPMVAMRRAHGWSQRDAAEQWNRRWPDDLKTFKSFSYWELYPAGTGYSPSLAVLSRLAQMYECSIADLLDIGDFRHLDRHHRPSPARSESVAQVLAWGAAVADEWAAIDTLVTSARQCAIDMMTAADGWQKAVDDYHGTVERATGPAGGNPHRMDRSGSTEDALVGRPDAGVSSATAERTAGSTVHGEGAI